MSKAFAILITLTIGIVASGEVLASVADAELAAPSSIEGAAIHPDVNAVLETGEGRGGANPSSAGAEKTLANGLYMSGVFTYLFSGSSASITLDRVDNDSFTRTTGTLRLELWATTVVPGRAQPFTGYRLVVFPTLNPMAPRTYYSGIVRSAAASRPPDGTYWLVLVLTEYAPSNCTRSDGFCQQDSFISNRQETWGAPAAPPSSLENPFPGSFQSGIGLISGWSCEGSTISVAIDGSSLSVPYGSPRGDTASICGGKTSTGFGLLVNFNLFGPGTHYAQLYVNGVARGSPQLFTVTVPSGEFMTGISRQVTVANFPSAGRTATLVWQQSQQNFAIQSVFP